jgi:hypothetical protein
MLYTFDARGLQSFSLTAGDKCRFALLSETAKIRAAEAQRQAGFYGSQVSVDQMARGTGGISLMATSISARRWQTLSTI